MAEIRLLGSVQVLVDGVPVDLGDLQQRYVLVVLALHANKPISTERLIETVWTDPPATNLIPGYIAKLRKAFRDAPGLEIDRTPTGYVLRVADDDVDVRRFLRLFDEAEGAARARDRGGRLAALRAAVALWRGRFLEDIDIDRVGGTSVVSPEERYLDAVGDLAELELAEGNHRWVRDRLRPLVNLDPARQRLALLLMRALTANGDRVQAMDVYHRCRDALDEWGMETSVELRRQAQFTQRVDGHNRVPAAPRRFAGRSAELTAITSLAMAGASANRPTVVWISGTPGVGKSALALRAAQVLAEHFPGGRLFLQLNGFTPNVAATDTMDALAQLLVQLGVAPEQLPASLGERAALYQSILTGTRTLVVLDNATDEKAVELLLPDVPGCLALVTSRGVGTLVPDEAVHLEPLPLGEAAALFRDLVGGSRTDAWPLLVDSVVQRCGQLPLLIKVAAAQFRQHHRWPLEHLVHLLAEAGGDLESPLVAAEKAACAVSYQQLSDPQRTLFRLIGRLPGPDLTVNAAAALLRSSVADARALLAQLQAVSLIEEVSPERYLMLDPLKEFAGTLPDATWPDEQTGALDRWLDFYLVTAGAATTAVFPVDRDRRFTVDRQCPVALEFADAAAARAWLDVERFNLLAAVDHAAAHDRPEHVWQLAVLLWRWHFTRGYLADWTETLETARATLETGDADRVGLAAVLQRLAGARRQTGDHTQALDLAERALGLWRELGDEQGEASTLATIGIIMLDQDDRQSAIRHYEAALAKFEKVGDQVGQANALDNLGSLNELRGELDTAHRRHTDAVAAFRVLDYPRGLAHALDNLGSTRQKLGLLDEAMAAHEESHRIAVEVGDRLCEAYALNNLGNVHRARGETTEALDYHERARVVADLVRDPGLGAQLYLDRAATHHRAGAHADALTAYRAALDLAAGARNRDHQAHAHHGIARVLHTTGDHVEGAPEWQAAIQGFAKLGWAAADSVRAELGALNCVCRTFPD